MIHESTNKENMAEASRRIVCPYAFVWKDFLSVVVQILIGKTGRKGKKEDSRENIKQ